ncbi:MULTISPECIES: PTS sugar transporter subunit IIA [Brevibacillus]|jgi:PTS system mannitol-specific IIA component|uniref:Mannitol-specific phosphotransferase enzyme IIA component n=2 Tax=Brevibacillus TaxID=55080 RepID=A0A1I3V3I4_9BACL|nr:MULTISPECIES: PTS sugar transporter subunit IIA [Brevibacillus]MEC2127458.1 PTS sugar transporter subunit IIA [Brevibacillus centrosporus]MED1791334.1 PTS sugar transporter subunit IIA [Brevibacillus nitrificans]MED4907342.1 PTS sugar transporter subunit IIA [Brevibacillus centrosporus]RNB67911.1 PTS mannitol transporter subunit IIA [Brevibacillus centrosporus]RNB79796.1 PTS mannitol transporter subunit IIA [Brevibacillus nitrificans]
MSNVLTAEKIMMNAKVASKEEGIRLAGELLVKGGHVSAAYIDKMQEREALATTYIGSGVAIPHGTNEAKQEILSTGISIVQVPDGVDFGEGNTAYLLIGIAAIGDEHLEVLSNIAVICSEEENVTRAVQAKTPEEIIALFAEGE